MESSVVFYEIQLVCLVFVCLVSLSVDWLVTSKRNTREEQPILADNDNGHNTTGKPNRELANTLKRKYLLVHGIVMGADWLQGPYLYSLYKEQYGFPERVVALFFVTGFVSAGMAAPVIGSWADQHGRRKTCLLFCLTYTLSCICITLPILPILLFGRILGGISTSILFSVFEAWLVSESNSPSLRLPAAELSTIMGRATLINGFVATSAGVISNRLVEVTKGNFAVPFMASGVLLLVGWVVIRGTWTENYGSVTALDDDDTFQLARLRKAWKIVCTDPVLVVLGLTQTCFEGSMYIFVFLWVPSLQESSPTPHLPLGYIFSSFMICMMLGSLIYTAIITYYGRQYKQTPSTSLRLHAQLSSVVSALGAMTFGVSVVFNGEHTRFWAFCVYEVCVGMYYPVQGTLRAGLISDEHRATLSSLFRVPLNVFVVVSLLVGVSEARATVLLVCAGMLTISSLMTAIVIGGSTNEEEMRTRLTVDSSSQDSLRID